MVKYFTIRNDFKANLSPLCINLSTMWFSQTINYLCVWFLFMCSFCAFIIIKNMSFRGSCKSTVINFASIEIVKSTVSLRYEEIL